MNILGLSAYAHDSAACLVTDGKIVAAAQEERFTRKKFDRSFPSHAILACLKQAGLAPSDIDHIVFYDERVSKDKICDALAQTLVPAQDWSTRLLFSQPHLSHAASAFFPSPFDEAAILTLDGNGSGTTTSLATGNGNQIAVQNEIQSPHSLGFLYAAFTAYIGFKANSGEYKMMGLAPYGTPKYADLIKEYVVDIKDDGSFGLNAAYFNFDAAQTLTNEKFHALFNAAPRQPESELTQRDMDMAASIQSVTEEIILKLARNAASTTGQKNLCLAGSVALNCVANGKILKEKIFDRIWIQPAAGEAGCAVGAALAAYHMTTGQPRNASPQDSMSGALLGPAFTQEEIESQLTKAGAVFSVVTEETMIDETAKALSEGKAVGWHQGRMEFGPRALGNRSILADPRSPHVQKQLNLKIKYRESFRPFAPSVLYEDVSAWFDLEESSPYMLLVTDVTDTKKLPTTPEQESLFGIDKLNVPRSTIPAVTHVDGSARVQTVHLETNPLFHRLLSKFKELTGCPVLVNTSFNVRGEPIVCSPEDAFHCLMGTELDLLVVGNCMVWKNQQDKSLSKDYKKAYPLD